MKNLVLLISLIVITFTSCYTQTVRIKNLPSTNDSLKVNDYLVTDEVSSGEVKKLMVEAIRKGLRLGYRNNVWNGVNDFKGPVLLPNVTTLTNLGYGAPFQRMLVFDGDSVLFYYDPEYGYRYLATRDWVLDQNFGSGGLNEVILDFKSSLDMMNTNELAWHYLDINGVRYPYLSANFANFEYQARDTIVTLPYLRNVMASYLNPYHFRKFGSPDSLEIVDSLFKGTIHGANISGASSEILYYGTNSVALNPTSNKNYLSASATETMPYKHQVTIYNKSSSYTVTLVNGLAFKLKSGSDIVLGQNDTIVLDYDGNVWRQIGGSDN